MHSHTSLEKKLREILEKNSLDLGKLRHRIPAAVLVPFCCIDNEWQLLFTKRTNRVANHQGEISFPGGAAEDQDLDLIETAIRETCEEIGLSREYIRVIGVMEPVPTVSNYCVLPVVAIVELTGALNLNPDEVEDIIYIPVNWLKDETNWRIENYYFAAGRSKPVIHYEDFNGIHLWGITAGMAQKIVSNL
jgi:8-oxo-dGTP pyrophosphatase MutT (NUDIX family)